MGKPVHCNYKNKWDKGSIIEMEAGVGDLLGVDFEAGAFLDFFFMSGEGPRSERVESNRRWIRRR